MKDLTECLENESFDGLIVTSKNVVNALELLPENVSVLEKCNGKVFVVGAASSKLFREKVAGGGGDFEEVVGEEGFEELMEHVLKLKAETANETWTLLYPRGNLAI